MAISQALITFLRIEDEAPEPALSGKLSQIYGYLSQGVGGEAWDRPLTPEESDSFWTLTYLDSDYPPLLKEMADPPAVLYGRGRREALSGPFLTMVGTRKASSYGLSVAKQFSGALALAGFTIVSGLALGTDAACHRGALEAGGKTVAVMACGIDQVYPSSHRKLAQSICREGAVLTEYPPGILPLKHHFIHRNRILSGLSMATLVVEAREKSGTMITSRYAGEQGRDLFAVPGNINQPRSSGCNWLIQQGAMLAQKPADILTALKGAFKNLPEPTTSGNRKNLNLPKDQAMIYDRLSSGPMYPEALLASLRGQVPDLWTQLTLMEMKGLVVKDGSGRYQIQETR